MEFKLYTNKQKLLQDNSELFNGRLLTSALSDCNLDVTKYETLTPTTFAFKFTDAKDFLLVLQPKPHKTFIYGAERMASYAANVIADYHLTVEKTVGETKLIDAFNQTYCKRLGGAMKQALFAGGCFWCMAKPYYEYEGVSKVLSGYAGGNELNPSYEEVKNGLTHHKETVMLEYNSEVITFKELLSVYFETIDPFDESGQFIDRGDNYTCAIFTDDLEERKIVAEHIESIERQFNRKVQVKILPNQVFYKAEEYHQDYALKNPAAFAEEERISGRLEHAKRKRELKKQR